MDGSTQHKRLVVACKQSDFVLALIQPCKEKVKQPTISSQSKRLQTRKDTKHCTTKHGTNTEVKKEEGKYKESIQPCPHLNRDAILEIDNATSRNHTQESKVSAFSQQVTIRHQ